MGSPVSVTLLNDIHEMQALQDFVDAFWEGEALPPEHRADLLLIIEEAVANVIQHAYQDDEEHEIRVELSAEGETVRAEIVDDAPPFNPLDLPAADTTSPIEERSPGGLGVHLYRSIADDVHYRRGDGENRLVMTIRA